VLISPFYRERSDRAAHSPPGGTADLQKPFKGKPETQYLSSVLIDAGNKGFANNPSEAVPSGIMRKTTPGKGLRHGLPAGVSGEFKVLFPASADGRWGMGALAGLGRHRWLDLRLSSSPRTK
jgi:hypothetical protein